MPQIYYKARPHNRQNRTIAQATNRSYRTTYPCSLQFYPSRFYAIHDLMWRTLSDQLVPYLKLMRLHQRTGIWLLLWPCWWSIALASQNIIAEFDLLVLFLFGAVVMRSAGCIINDIWDREIDRHVARTAMRPLASGTLKLSQALILLAILLLAGLAILLALNPISRIFAVAFMGLVIIYPLMKRIMRIPQIFLGLTFNAGAIIGWTATRDTVSIIPILLYVACFFWTIGYDTIYAHQDKKDDAKIGVQSAALAFGTKTRIYVGAQYIIMCILLAQIGIIDTRQTIYYVGIGIAVVHLMWQTISVNLDDSDDCMRKFQTNATFGWIPFMSIIISGGTL